MPLKVLPSVVFSMTVPFTESQVYERIKQIHEEVGPLSKSFLSDLSLTVDIYPENLVHYGLLVQEGAQYTYRSFGKRYQPREIKHECV